MHSKILILREYHHKPDTEPNTLVVSMQELVRWIKSGKILSHLLRYRESRLLTYRLDLITDPFATSLFLRLLSRGDCVLNDESRDTRTISWMDLFHLFGVYFTGLLQRPAFLTRQEREVAALEKEILAGFPSFPWNPAASPIYLRTDHVFGLKAGGSVGHTSGVLNNLKYFSGPPVFITTFRLPTIDESIETHEVSPSGRFQDFRELPFLDYNDHLFAQVPSILQNRAVSFIYQRYSIHNYLGLKLARSLRIPFILEFNGPEVWVNRHWGVPLRYEHLAERIELLNLNGADVVVVVSQPLKEGLIRRGVDPDKILVNPNGVDPERYSPEVSGNVVRTRYALEGKTVIGFIGTFGRWHGAEVLARAFGRLLQEFPEYRDHVRLLMVGNGNTMPQVKQELERFNVTEETILTGMVPQEEGPRHLAACDILASPHVPNPDGTPFFGSPTKLFEYMAMGKGIVASDLDQIGELLKHNETACLVPPGDPEALMHGMKILIDQPELRQSLGTAARAEAVARYSWKEHTRRIVDILKERCPCD